MSWFVSVLDLTTKVRDREKKAWKDRHYLSCPEKALQKNAERTVTQTDHCQMRVVCLFITP